MSCLLVTNTLVENTQFIVNILTPKIDSGLIFTLKRYYILVTKFTYSNQNIFHVCKSNASQCTTDISRKVESLYKRH